MQQGFLFLFFFSFFKQWLAHYVILCRFVFMCGVLGFLGEFEAGNDFLKSGLKAIEHRGRDAEGHYYNAHKGIALGHRRLSIIDTTNAANQPMFSSDGRFVIVYNGEVYNFKSLQKVLNYTPKTGSDTEIILEAYRHWGSECVQYFNGMFALLIFDLQKELLFVARDRFGKKPLYYTQSNKGFCFASEWSALKTMPGMQDERLKLNKQALAAFLHMGFVPEPNTMFDKIWKFPAGHYGIFTKAGYNISSYFKVEWHKDHHGKNAKELHEEFDLVLRKAVEKRLFADVPYGALLSGGIDSSLVCAYASDLSKEKLKTFTIGFEDRNKDERIYAEQVALALNSEHHSFVLKEKDALEKVALLDTVYDEAFLDSSAIPTMLVSEMASKEVKMVLTGDGGDEMFLGYGAYRWSKRLQNPLIFANRKQIARLLNLGNDHKKRAAALLNYTEGGLANHIFSQEQYLFSLSELSSFLHEPLSPILPLSPNANYSMETQNIFDIAYYLKEDLLVKTDRAGMYYGLEMRSPLLDKEVAHFAMGMTAKQKMEKGELKGFLKQHLYKRLPASLFDRPKQGFSVPLNRWLKGELNYLVQTYIQPQALEKWDIWQVDRVMALRKEWETGAHRHYNKMWAIIQLQRFLEKND